MPEIVGRLSMTVMRGNTDCFSSPSDAVCGVRYALHMVEIGDGVYLEQAQGSARPKKSENPVGGELRILSVRSSSSADGIQIDVGCVMV
jgi:hypothetical protein